MQEEVESRTITLSVSAVKLTGRIFKAAIVNFMQHKKEKKLEKARAGPVKPQGKQTVKELVGQNQGVTNIEVSDKGIKSFDRIARKYGVDYAIKKDRSVMPPKYLIFFKGRDNDAITAAFTEYTANVVKQKEKPSLLQQLRKLRDIAPSLNPDKIRNKHQEAER
ncbi:MAG: PcfB family protein [Oscillospiraceae bacterium]|nr:PcfB family protein [Oscillospiraceae bacterium]